MKNIIGKFLPNDWFLKPHNVVIYYHSRSVAKAAMLIAEKIPNMDSKKAYDFGLLHDIGKFSLCDDEKYKHPRFGYEMLKKFDPESAAICASHPFPNFENFEHILKYCHEDEAEAAMLHDILKTIEKNNYIELIQLCDKVSAVCGYVSVEDKINWYVLRHGLDYEKLKICYIEPLTIIRKKLEVLANCDIYSLLKIRGKGGSL